MLTAADNGPADGGCFTRELVACLRNGLDGVPGEYLRSVHVQGVIAGLCPYQKPQHLSYNADEGLYLAKNAALARRAGGPSWAGRRRRRRRSRVSDVVAPADAGAARGRGAVAGGAVRGSGRSRAVAGKSALGGSWRVPR